MLPVYAEKQVLRSEALEARLSSVAYTSLGCKNMLAKIHEYILQKGIWVISVIFTYTAAILTSSIHTRG